MASDRGSVYVGQVKVRRGKLPYILVGFTDVLFAVLSNPSSAIASSLIGAWGKQRYTDKIGDNAEETVQWLIGKNEYGRATAKASDLRGGVRSDEFATRAGVSITIPTSSVEKVTFKRPKAGDGLSVVIATTEWHLVSFGKLYGFSIGKEDMVTARAIMLDIFGSRIIVSDGA